MTIADIMTGEARCCHPETNLATAAALMWAGDCGALPVVDAEGRALGMITDRDVCMAVATRNRLASEIAVGELLGGDVWACEAHDDVRAALEVMEEKRVRRLPVIDSENRVIGVISMNDVVLNAVERKGGKKGETPLTYESAMAAMKMISAHRDAPASFDIAPEGTEAKSGGGTRKRAAKGSAKDPAAKGSSKGKGRREQADGVAARA